MQITVAIAGVAAALVVLLTVTAIPLWLFNVLSSVIYVVLVPVGAAAMAYVYGALAMRSEAPESDLAGSVAGPSPVSS